MIGGALLNDVGIKYLDSTIPSHSITTLITSDGKVYWQDFLSPDLNKELTDEDIDEGTGGSTTMKDVVAYGNEPSGQALVLHLKDNAVKINPKNRGSLSVLPPGEGAQLQVLTWVMHESRARKDLPTSLVAFEKAKNIASNDSAPYINLSLLQAEMGKHSDAMKTWNELADAGDRDYVLLTEIERMSGNYTKSIDALEKALVSGARIEAVGGAFYELFEGIHENPEVLHQVKEKLAGNPKIGAELYRGLGLIYLGKAGRAMREGKKSDEMVCNRKALSVYQEALDLDPENPENKKVYSLMAPILEEFGSKQEAIEAWREFLKLTDREKDKWKIKFAESDIQRLTEEEV